MTQPVETTTDAAPARARRPALVRRSPAYRALLASFGISGIGDWMCSVALAVWILDETGSPGWVSAFVVLRFVPYALLSSLGGAIADRVDRRRLMISLDLARVAVFSVLAVIVAQHGHGWVAAAIGCTTIAAVLNTPYRPAVVATTPLVVGEDDLATANALESTIGQLTWLVGPAVGAAVLTATSVAWAVAIDAATFAISALLLARLPSAAGAPAAPFGADDTTEADDGSFRRHLAAGFRTVRDVPGAALLTGFVAVVLLAWGFELVLHVVVAQRQLGIGAAGVGWMTAAIGIGGLVVAPVTGRLARSGRTGLLLVGSGVLLGAPLAALAITHSPAVAYALLVAEGIGNIAFEVLSVTTLQRLVPNELLGRVQGIQDQAGAVASVAGSIAAPILVAAVSLHAALVIGGGILVVYSLLALPRFAALDRRLLAARAALAPKLAVLRTVSILDGATEAALERMARAITEETAAAGAVVVREGDVADAVFVVQRGRLHVEATGYGEVNQLGSGDAFGEIGLVEHRPRTATVVADTDVVLWRIPGAVFLGALHDDMLTGGALRTMIGERLARTGG